MWNADAFKSRSVVVLTLGFGILIALIGVTTFSAIRRARAIYNEMEATQDLFLQTESFRRDIAADMYLADILVRDYLLDPSPHNAPLHREHLLQIRSSLQARVELLSKRLPEPGNGGLLKLQEEVQNYWDSLDPIFEWTPEEKAKKSWFFLRHMVLPRRQAVMDLAREVARLNRENLARERLRIQESQDVLQHFLIRMMIFALTCGTIVALFTTYWVSALEKRHEAQRKRIEHTEDNLRRLSRRLVQAQEVERKALSRELHDEVGQTLTALGMEVANLEKLRDTDPQAFRAHLEDTKRLNADAMRAIRDLAMGLRPSMLDDLGLEPALQWQGREFSRHTGVPATVQVNGPMEYLTEGQSTCIYRVVQEALTNCARHAQATSVLVSVQAEDHRVIVVVQDDGVGFDPASHLRGGLGLLGIDERVQALDGRVKISSAPRKGTTVRVEIPLKQVAV